MEDHSVVNPTARPGAADAIRERDLLWLKAMIATLDLRLIELVVRWFNANRPD